MSIEELRQVIGKLRTAMTDARQNESHFESWMILNEAICDSIDDLRQAIEQAEKQEPVAYSGNGTAGQKADVRPTAFFIQADKKQEPACWVTSDSEGFRMRLSPPVTDVPLKWMPLYTAPLQHLLDEAKEQGRKQERALWEMARVGQEIEKEI